MISRKADAKGVDNKPLSSGVSVLLNGARVPDVSLAADLDFALARIGLVGGEVSFAVLSPQNVDIVVSYWSPRALTLEELGKLHAYTEGQLADGAGEGGFELDLAGEKIHVYPNASSELTVKVVDDGRAIPSPSPIAIAAREGDLIALRKALAQGEAVDSRLQGYTGLHLAILFGHLDEASELLAHRADPNARDRIGDTPLHMCALANSLDDAASQGLAKELLAFGARAELRTAEGQTALELANLRKKTGMAALLRRI
jgi:hypothetical protein